MRARQSGKSKNASSPTLSSAAGRGLGPPLLACLAALGLIGPLAPVTRADHPEVQIAKLQASDLDELDQFGSAVAIEGDYAVVGAPWDNNPKGENAGAAYVFHFDGANWVEQAKLVASDGAADDNFGWAVAISNDYVAVGAPHDDDADPGDHNCNSGSAYVFHREDASWLEVVKLVHWLPWHDCGDRFGYSVAIDTDREPIRVLIGAPRNDWFGNDAGLVFGFRYNSWDQVWEIEQLLQACYQPHDNDWFGQSVAIDGYSAVVGAPFVPGGGAACTYEYMGYWATGQQLLPTGCATQQFGWDVDISGPRIVVGAREDVEAGGESGSAYFFEKDGGNWTLINKVQANDGQYQAYFGESVGISGLNAIIGAPGDSNQNGTGAGAAYIFTRGESVWSQAEKLLASDGGEGDWFGRDVAISGAIGIVGAPSHDNPIYACGAAYLFGPQETPLNDDCASAEPVGDVINLAFDTTYATHDGNGTCMSGPNIWYCYTASCTGVAIISLCGSSYDTMLAVYEGCTCDPLGTELCCNDDFCGLQSECHVPVVAGQEYLIEVGGYGNLTGQGLLSITCLPDVTPPNDDCANAESIGDVTGLPFDTTFATFDGNGTCMSSPNIWYCYTASCTGNATISLCGSSYDTMLAVYDGCTCDPLGVELCCNDDFCGLQSECQVQVVAGQEYLIEVGGYSTWTGSGVLTVTCQGPTTWTVCHDGTGDFLTIQEGIDAAQPGDTVVVCCGTYYENAIDMKSGIHLRSETGEPDCVTIDGQGQDTIMYCQGVNNATIEGFTFTHGLSPAGGAIWLESSSPLITRCVFVENGADGEGGGALYIHFYSNPVVSGCDLIANWASSQYPDVFPDGGAVKCDFYCEPLFQYCRFEENWCADDGGALMSDRYCSITMDQCEFTRNMAYVSCDHGWMTSGGGAIYSTTDAMSEDPPPDVTVVALTECVFPENSSEACGGAIYCFHSSQVEAESCRFNDNVADDMGGAIACYGNAGPTLDHCTFDENSAGPVGGGGVWAYFFSPQTIRYCTFYGNTAWVGGTGVKSDGTSQGTFDNVIMAFGHIANAIDCAGNGNTLTCCDLYGNEGGDWNNVYISGQLGTSGNICLDPLFCKPHHDDFTLAANSPCAPQPPPGCNGMGAWPVVCAARMPGDLDCSGAVDFDDIDAFVLALTGWEGYEAQYPACNWLNGDCNLDGDVDFDDIDAFVVLLSGG